MDKTSFEINALLFLGFMGSFCNAMGGSCNERHPAERIECGWAGITQQQCEEKDCCFDSTFPRSLWCFKKDEHTKASSPALIVIGVGTKQAQTVRSARIDTAGRGYLHLSELLDSDLTVDELEGAIVRSCSMEVSEREDCGWPGINQEVCENRGCCYDDDVKKTYWCYRPKTSFTQPIVETIMKCTAECANMSWRKTIRVGILCQTGVTCWLRQQGIMGATCMTACKSNTRIWDLIGNVSLCLGLSYDDQEKTIEQCEFDVNCWVQRHGIKAANCFSEVSTRLDEVEETVGDYGQVAMQPNPAIQMPRQPMRPPAESGSSFIPYERPTETIPTDLDAERAVLYQFEVLTQEEEEEEPRRWWETPLRA